MRGSVTPFRITLSLLVVAVTIFVFWHVIEWRRTSGEQFRRAHVMSILGDVPTVSNVVITGYQDEFEFSIADVRVELEGSHPKSMILSHPSLDFRTHLPLKQIDDIKLFYRDLSKDFVSHPNFGTKGEFTSQLGLKVSDVADLIEFHDVILKAVSFWPEEI